MKPKLSESPSRCMPAAPSAVFVAAVVIAICAGVPATVALLAGCTPLQEFATATGADINPPRYLGLSVTDAHTLSIRLDKPARAVEHGLVISPPLGAISTHSDGPVLLVRTELGTKPGAAYLIEGTVEDQAGNSLRFLLRFFGYNPRLPELLINELNPRGSGNNPETVELVVLSDGDLAGVTVYNGTAGNWDNERILPPLEVVAGDFILVHFRPQGIAEEIDETERKDASGGRNSSDAAWDFWVPDGSGLPSNNGVVSLYSFPGGELMDAVIYTDRTSHSDERYLGFGTARMLQRVEEITAGGGWLIEGERPRPEDMVDVSASTATRSLNRSSDSRDTDTREDWHIVPTRGLTFGAVNSDEVHQR